MAAPRPGRRRAEEVVLPLDERDERRLVMDRAEADLARHVQLAQVLDGLRAAAGAGAETGAAASTDPAPSLVVDVTGKGVAYATVRLREARALRVHVGAGVFVPMTLDEAAAYVERRLPELEARVEEADRAWALSIAVHAAARAKEEWDALASGGGRGLG